MEGTMLRFAADLIEQDIPEDLKTLAKQFSDGDMTNFKPFPPH